MGVGNSASTGGMGMGRRVKRPAAESQDAAAEASEQQGCLLATVGWLRGHQGCGTEEKRPSGHSAIRLSILVSGWMEHYGA